MKRTKKRPPAPSRPVIFEFQDYKSYIDAWVQSRPNGGRGERSRIAERVRCHVTYVSQVLNGQNHFSLEQGEALNSLFEHNEEECDFFILLLENARAGTADLKKHFQRKIQKVLDQRLVLKNRFSDKKTLGREDQATYYSDWAYCAVHMAVLISSLRTPGAIAEYLGLSLSKTTRILQFLESVGLIRREGGGFASAEMRIHLESDSPMISKHHTNWRIQAIRSLDRETPSELHYSSVVTISHEDLPRVREILVKAIEQVRSVVRASENDAIYCYTVDLYGLVARS
jgi:uncharacterized protein (TIGR02147 family)